MIMKQQLKKLINALGYDIRGTRMTPRQLLEPPLQRTLEFDDIVCRRMFERGEVLTFVQVGAFDGNIQDPLRKYIARCGWRGVLVEPQPGPAAKLRDLYRMNDQIKVLEAAIDETCGGRLLFTVDVHNAPAWAGGLASFDKNVILRHTELIPNLDSMIREVPVNCITFDEVLALSPAEDLDLLQLDTEGADGFILSLFPFDCLRPAIIHWEIKHMSLTQREMCLGRLASLGYRFAPSGTQDMLAVLEA